MSHVDDKLIELARTALSLEFGGQHFYRRAAQLTEHASGKKMFLRLAEQEVGHMKELHKLFGGLLGEELWKQMIQEEGHGDHPSKVAAELEAAVIQRNHSAVADDTQALRLAMEFERKAINLFTEMKAHTEDPEILDLVGKMVEEECFHYDSLQAQLDSILNVGIWLDEPEFRMDGKF